MGSDIIRCVGKLSWNR